MELQFREWLHKTDEGFWTAAVVGIQAFRKELRRSKWEHFDRQLSEIANAKDILFALDDFYRMVEPGLNDEEREEYEAKLGAIMKKFGYGESPRDFARTIKII